MEQIQNKNLNKGINWEDNNKRPRRLFIWLFLNSYFKKNTHRVCLLDGQTSRFTVWENQRGLKITTRVGNCATNTTESRQWKHETDVKGEFEAIKTHETMNIHLEHPNAPKRFEKTCFFHVPKFRETFC